MTTLEDWQRIHRGLADVNISALAAAGGGPPLKYLWIPFVIVGAIAGLLWLI